MPTYQSKIVEIEARELTRENVEELADWSRGKALTFENNDNAYLEIHTLEGTMTADLGDFIIQGLAGEFYPCKPEIFHAKYEKISD